MTAALKTFQHFQNWNKDQSKNSLNIQLLEINFYAILRYVEQDSEVYFSQKKKKKFSWKNGSDTAQSGALHCSAFTVIW